MDIIPIEHQKDYKLILDYINAYKNGVTSDAMYSYGISYKKNYGVSMISLRSIAERFKCSHAFANLLWKKGWRETYILATMLDDVQVYNIELLDQRVSESPTFELLEQLAYNLAWRLDFLDEYFAKTVDRDSQQMHYFLIKCTTYQLMQKTLSSKSAFERISKFTFSDNVAILSVLQNLLLRITNVDNALHAEVVAYCEQYKSDAWLTLTEVIREYGA